MVNDRSYLCSCNFFSYMPNYVWGFIVVGSGLGYFLIKLMKFVGTLDDKKVEEQIIQNESELEELK